jgi:subtilisin family serine protease
MKMPDVKRKRFAMRKQRFLLLTGLVTLAVVPPAAAQSPEITQQFILRATPDDGPLLAARHNRSIRTQILTETTDGTLGVYLVTTPTEVAGVVEDVKSDTAVLSFEKNHVVAIPETSRPRLAQSTAAILETLPDRTLIPYWGPSVWRGYAFQPAATIIRAVDAHALFATGGGIVAIIDTGIDVDHPVLAGAIVPGFDFLRNQVPITSDLSSVSQSTAAILEMEQPGEPFVAARVNQSTAAILEQSTAAILEGEGLPPAFGHGTMVAGLVRLVAPTARIMPLTAFGPDGAGDVYNIERAIYYAVDHGANVINMSFSLENWSAELVRALNYANEHDVICVASAGNNAEETLVFPSAFRHVIGVGSTNNLDRRSAFSNYGNGLLHVAAPGEALITAFPGGRYAAAWGTSFSAALVSGAAALLEQLVPGIEPTNAEEALSRAKRIGQDLGDGRLDLYLALQRAAK